MVKPPEAPSLLPLVRVLANARATVFALLAITAGLLAWHHYGMERVIDLTGPGFEQAVDDDRVAGGASVATLERRGRTLVMHCRIAGPTAWPYCKLMFSVRAGQPGIDLSAMNDIVVEVDHTGSGNGVFGIVLANDEDGLTHQDDWRTFKINDVNGLLPARDTLMEVPLKWFGVAQWWKDMVKPPVEHSYPRMDRVVRIELITQSGNTPGESDYTVRTLHLRGKLISENTLLICLVGLWMTAAVAWPAATALLLREQLRHSNAALARQREISDALELETRELAGQAHIDPLTGVLNREGLRAALIGSPALTAEPMSVVFIDIDHFKHINDTAGHDVGDKVLRQFARLVVSEVRSSDRLVRWGGEEFLLVCPMTGVEHAVALAEKLRCALHRQAWPAGIAVTASFGVAQHLCSEDIGVVIRRADKELYRAKASGRDRVHAYLTDADDAKAAA